MQRPVGSVQDLGNGKYRLRVSMVDDYGKRHQPSKVVKASGKREANRLLREFTSECEANQAYNNPSCPKTLQDMYDEWMRRHVKPNLSQATVTWYSEKWEKYLKDKGNIKLNIIRPSHIYDMLDDVKSTRKPKQGEELKDIPRTRKAAYTTLQAMLSKAVLWGYITSNPCNAVEPPEYTAEERETLSEQEIKTVMEHIFDEDVKYQAMFFLATICGMRRQEIVALKWSSIDFTKRAIRVKKGSENIKGVGTKEKKTKNKPSNRTLHLPDTLVPVLLHLKNEQTMTKAKLGELWHDEDLLFTQWNGLMMSIHTPTQWWKKFAKKYDINPLVTFHCLRHTAATYMITNNVPISTVSGVLGHASVSTTLKIYTHVIEDTKAAAIEAMENVIVPKAVDNNDQTKKIS